jgi:hypothetical protein
LPESQAWTEKGPYEPDQNDEDKRIQATTTAEWPVVSSPVMPGSQAPAWQVN